MIKQLISFVFSLFLVMATVGAHAVDITYTYDQLNRLTSVRYQDGTTIEYIYDDIGNRIIRNRVRLFWNDGPRRSESDNIL